MNNIDVAHPRPGEEPLDARIRKIVKDRIKAFCNSPLHKARLLEIRANIAYLTGHQNIEVVNGQIHPIKSSSATSIVTNKILPAVINDIAHATKIPPGFDVIPTGTEDSHKAAAKAGDKILRYLRRINDFDQQRKALVLWYDLAAQAFRKIYWHDHHSIEGMDPETGQPIFKGEVVSQFVPPTELIYDFRVKDLSKLDWIIHVVPKTIANIEEEFGEEFVNKLEQTLVEGRKYTPRTQEENDFEQQFLGDMYNLAQGLGINKPSDSELDPSDRHVLRYEFWHRPTRSMPTGAYAVIVEDEVAVNVPYPLEQYPHGELPFVPYTNLTLEGLTTGIGSRITQARPIQRAYNKLQSLIHDNVDTMGNSVLIAAREAKVDYRRLDNVSGNVIEYDRVGGIPSREPGVQMPGTIFAYADMLGKSIDELFAFHEPSKGINPVGGPRSGIGLQTLQEADSLQQAPVIRALEKADEKAAYQMLTLAQANYGPRLLPIVGKDSEWTLFSINPDELKGKISVIVQPGSSLPINKAAKQEQLFTLWQSGLFGNPLDEQTRLHVLNSMELGPGDLILEDIAKDINFAQKEFHAAVSQLDNLPPIPPDLAPEEIAALVEAYVFVPPPNTWDNHGVHLTEHKNYIKAHYYEFLQSDDIRLHIVLRALLTHLELTQMIYTEQLVMQTMLGGMKLN